MYDLIADLRPYFFSLREIDKNVSLDLKIPASWKLEHIQKIVSQYKSIALKVQDKNEKFYLISFVTIATEEGYNTARVCASEVISFNKELLEKEKLFKEKMSELEKQFKEKIDELQKVFSKESLDKLKQLNLDNDEENTTGDRLVEQGDQEGSTGD